MRTNIDIDDDLMAAAMRAANLPTKRATVEEGLRLLIRQARHRSVRALRGTVKWEGDLDAWRRNG